MIFYFSGTGNSQFAAIQLAKTLGEGLVSIGRGLRSAGKQTFHSERPLVFVAPTYAWRMPKVVEKWILQTTFQGNLDAYFVLTCGGDCGNAAAYAQRLCWQVGLRFCGLAPVVMPENYLALFPTPDEAECRAMVEQAKPVWKGDCTPCTACIGGCPTHNIVEQGKTAKVVAQDCILCRHCAAICPKAAVVMTGFDEPPLEIEGPRQVRLAAILGRPEKPGKHPAVYRPANPTGNHVAYPGGCPPDAHCRQCARRLIPRAATGYGRL